MGVYWHWNLTRDGVIRFGLMLLVFIFVSDHLMWLNSIVHPQIPIGYILLIVFGLAITRHLYRVLKWYRVWLRYGKRRKYEYFVAHISIYVAVILFVFLLSGLNFHDVYDNIAETLKNNPRDVHDGYTAQIIGTFSVCEQYNIPIMVEQCPQFQPRVEGYELRNESIDVLEIQIDYIKPYIYLPYAGKQPLCDLMYLDPVVVTADGVHHKAIPDRDICKYATGCETKFPYYVHKQLNPNDARDITKGGNKHIRPDTSISWYIPFEKFDHTDATFQMGVRIQRDFMSFGETITIPLSDN